MKFFPLLRFLSISVAFGSGVMGSIQLNAQTATPPCEAHFRMFRYDGFELFADDTVCLGTEVTFVDESTTPNGAMVNWSWQFESGAQSSDQNPVHIFPSEDVVDIQLTVDDGSTCFPATVEFALHIIAPPTFDYSTHQSSMLWRLQRACIHHQYCRRCPILHRHLGRPTGTSRLGCIQLV
jgi:hypothetical protein